MSRKLIEQIRSAYDHQTQIEALRNEPFQMPLDLNSPMMEYVMERSYLEETTKRQDFNCLSTTAKSWKKKESSLIPERSSTRHS